MSTPRVYDRVRFHEAAARDAGHPREQAAAHIGLLAGWLADRGLFAPWARASFAEGFTTYGRTRRGTDLVVGLDGALFDDMFTEEGAAFLDAYYGPEGYLADYAELLVGPLGLGDYGVTDTPEHRARLEPRLDARLAAWRAAWDGHRAAPAEPKALAVRSGDRWPVLRVATPWLPGRPRPCPPVPVRGPVVVLGSDGAGRPLGVGVLGRVSEAAGQLWFSPVGRCDVVALAEGRAHIDRSPPAEPGGALDELRDLAMEIGRGGHEGLLFAATERDPEVAVDAMAAEAGLSAPEARLLLEAPDLATRIDTVRAALLRR